MHAVTRVTGRASAIRRSNIDTDQIIPAVWMKRVERTGYADGLFQNWRKDPAFVLNRPERAQTTILVAGPNFGCGSSRQHAVWALRDWGIRAVISTQIADIHRTNLPNEGLVPVVASPETVEVLMDAVDADPDAEISIDVEGRTLTCTAAGLVDVPFSLDDAAHYNLVHGYDPIDLTLMLEDVIAAHERGRDPWLPVGRAASA
ncbi:MAG: 3-isopropylmalate dehydratase small subunit [Leifsonia sp.]|uniref:3-isopropylmalate dehydratase small subunit n=1 Tax=Leifsonia sp. TaxID=1870902 RepID=UPI003F822EA8